VTQSKLIFVKAIFTGTALTIISTFFTFVNPTFHTETFRFFLCRLDVIITIFTFSATIFIAFFAIQSTCNAVTATFFLVEFVFAFIAR